MQEKFNHFQSKASKKEYKVQQQSEQQVKKDQYEEWENEQEEVVESSSNTCPSRKIIDNEIYEITNIQLDPEQVDIARQQYLGNNTEV